MSLKKQIKLDAALFFNLSEFGEMIDINGKLMPGLWDDTAEAGPQYHDVTGINVVERILLLLIPGDDSWEEPVPGQELDVDGTLWMVKDIKDQGDIAKIILYRHAS